MYGWYVSGCLMTGTHNVWLTCMMGKSHPGKGMVFVCELALHLNKGK